MDCGNRPAGAQRRGDGVRFDVCLHAPVSTVPGDHQFCVWVDATGLITENIESNNGTCAALVSILPVPPQITVQPKSLYTKAGRSITFNVAAIGTAPLSYQWQYNGANITNAINATLTLNNVLLNWTGNTGPSSPTRSAL